MKTHPIRIPAFVPLALAVFLLGCPPGARAAVIALYPFTGSSLASTDTEANTDASSLSVGSQITQVQFFAISGGDTTSGAPSYQGNGSAAGGTAWSATLNPDQYFSFSVSVDSGYEMDLSSLTFFASKNSGGPDSWEVRSSIYNYTSALGSGTGVNQGSPPAVWTNPTVTLSLSNITAPVEFRIYAFNGATGNFRLDDITLNGTVAAVPEPSSAALLLGGLGVLAVMRRMRGRKA